jgi:hypothetical protein
MRNQARILVVALALSAAGCSLMVDPEKNDPLKTARGFCNSAQDAFVKLYERCGYPASLVEPLVAQWRVGCVNMGNSAAAGRVSYDRSVAEQCIAAFDAASRCDESMFGNVFSLCALATQGTVPPGGACYTESRGFVSECAGGGACDSSATCPGVCVVPGQVGQPCASIYPYCDSGLSCEPNVSGPSTCKALGGYNYTLGQYDPCGTIYDPPCDSSYYYCNTTTLRCAYAPSSDGASCNLTGGTCASAYNVHCVYDSAAPTPGWYCRPPGALNANCSDGRGCVAGTYCRYESGISYCRAVPSGLQPVGGDCYRNGDLDCQAGLFCRYWTDDTCQAPVAVGATCTHAQECGSPAITCAIAPTGTSGGSGTCVAMKGLGSTCRAGYEECQQGLWCEAVSVGSTGVCRGFSGVGGKCNSVYTVLTTGYEYAECAPGIFCNAGTCAAYLAAGVACSSDTQCGAPYSGVACMPIVAGNSCSTPGNCNCTPNACSLAFGWLGF